MGSWLVGRTVLVTGASRGIGCAVARRLAAEGAQLALLGRDEAALRETDSAFASKRHLIIPADLADASSPKTVVGCCASFFGGLDALVNNAGLASQGPFESETSESWERLMQVNAKAPFFLTQALLPMLKKAKGRIVNIASVVAHEGYAQQAIYSASKHALLGWSKALAREMVPHGVRVHVVCPGGVATEMVATMRPDLDAKELIQPDEVADAVAWLLSASGQGAVDEISMRRSTKMPF